MLDLCLRRFILIRDVSLCEHRRQYILPRFFEISANNQEFSDFVLPETEEEQPSIMSSVFSIGSLHQCAVFIHSPYVHVEINMATVPNKLK